MSYHSESIDDDLADEAIDESPQEEESEARIPSASFANGNVDRDEENCSNISRSSSSSRSSRSIGELAERRERQRQLALEAVERDATRAWPTLREEYRHDKEFILSALKSPKLPPKPEFERKFSQSLRFDRDVVLAFCARPDFKELHFSRGHFVPDCLTSDKEVMLAYCSRIPRSLQECSEELRDDREVVEAAIALDGLELQYATPRLREERDLVVAACQKNGRALEFCPPGRVLHELTSDRNFMLSVLTKDAGSLLRLAPDDLKRDRELVLQALAHGLSFRYVPSDFSKDTHFLLEAVALKSSLYLEMNRNLQHNYDLALAAVVAPDSLPDIHAKALLNCPNLARDRQAVLAFCRRGEKQFLEELLESNDFADDKPIMMEAIQRDCRLFSSASERLRQDPGVILVSIQESSAWSTLKTVPWNIQRQHPEITIKAIQLCCRRNIRFLPSHLPEDLWNNRDIVLAWIKRGGRVLEAFERNLTTDRELALAVAEFNSSEFYKVGDALLRNREFMIQAVQRDGRVLRFAAPEIRQDFDVVVQAVANNKRTIGFCRYCRDIDFTAFKDRVREKMRLHETFLNEFLRGIAVSTPHVPPGRRSHLPMLDRGVETSQAFKKLIAEYLGVPVGRELTLLNAAWRNLELNNVRANPHLLRHRQMQLRRHQNRQQQQQQQQQRAQQEQARLLPPLQEQQLQLELQRQREHQRAQNAHLNVHAPAQRDAPQLFGRMAGLLLFGGGAGPDDNEGAGAEAGVDGIGGGEDAIALAPEVLAPLEQGRDRMLAFLDDAEFDSDDELFND